MASKSLKASKKARRKSRDSLFGIVISKLRRGLSLTAEEANFLFDQKDSGILNEPGILDSLSFSVEDAFSGSDITELFVERPEEKSQSLAVWCPDVEAEMLRYFQKHPEQMRAMAPRRFEELVAAIFKNNGFRVELTPPTRDGGVDIIAVEDSIFTGQSIHLVECKRYGGGQTVGIGIVQRLLGVVTQLQATKGIIVTTSYFTRDAIEASLNTKHILTLRDYDVLVAWLKGIGTGRIGDVT